MNNLSIVGVEVRQDSEGRYSLNDLHKAAGKEKKHSPNYFLSNQQTTDLVGLLSDTGIPVSTKKGGKNQGTYACKEIVYAYAMWISPEFHLQVIRAYDALVKGDIEAAKRIANRMIVKDEYLPMTNAVKESKMLEGKPVKHYHFSNENNMIYKVLLGVNAKQYKESNGVESVRDNLTTVEQEALISLQRANTSMLELGYDYDKRKNELENLYGRLWFNKLKEEHILLEA